MTKKVKRIKIGKKMYSLNDIWRLCRKMWDDIKDEPRIFLAKDTWLEKHEFILIDKDKVVNNVEGSCFFCEWAKQEYNRVPRAWSNTHCSFCPGRIVSPYFDCCCSTYHFRGKPKKFAAQIKALDLKRIH